MNGCDTSRFQSPDRVPNIVNPAVTRIGITDHRDIHVVCNSTGHHFYIGKAGETEIGTAKQSGLNAIAGYADGRKSCRLGQ